MSTGTPVSWTPPPTVSVGDTQGTHKLGYTVHIVVVGQTDGSISSKTLDYDCLYTPLVHTWIVHGIVDCYQLTRTFGGFYAQCLSKLFLKEFAVLLLTTSLGRAFQVVVILIGSTCWATDVLKCFTINFAPLFLVLSLRSSAKSPLALTVVNSFRYLNTSISCPRSLLCSRLMRSRSWIHWW